MKKEHKMKEITKIKQAIFLCLPTLVFILLAEIICSFISPKQSVFWENPMMLQYPVKKFDETATRNDLHFSNDTERVVRYVPDKQRWYRLDPEPTIPKDGKLLLHFGDSSTWGWGLNDRGYTYANVLQGLLSDSMNSINLGVPGYTSLQGLKYLESLVKQYHNRIIGITIYFGNNDAVENGLPDSLKLISSQKESYLRNINMWLENHL